MKRLHAIAAPVAGVLVMLSACTTPQGPEPKINPPVREVPVPVPCKPLLSPEPAYPDTDAALSAVTDVFDGTKLLKAGRTVRIARLAELADALKACESAQ